MLNNIICAGIGGQGVLTLGMVIADSAASQGNYVTWVPEYEGTMRGGASCTKVRIIDNSRIRLVKDFTLIGNDDIGKNEIFHNQK